MNDDDKTVPRVRPTPRQLNRADLLALTVDDLLDHVATLRQVDPVTAALASKLRNLHLVLERTRSDLEEIGEDRIADPGASST